MILIDDRTGSAELANLFSPFGVETKLQRLEFGDFAFLGNGPDMETVGVAVERKAVSDFVSSMRSKRLAGHQMRGLLKDYGYVYIVVEGVWRAGDHGAIETRQWDRESKKLLWKALYLGSRPVLFTEVDHHIATLQHKRGIVFGYTGDQKQTVAYVVSRYRWWNDKEWHQHRSDEAIYDEYIPPNGTGRKASFSPRTVPDVEMMVAQVKGIGPMAYSIAKVFPTMERLVGASVAEIMEVRVEQRGKLGVRTVKLGEERARRIYLALRGEK